MWNQGTFACTSEVIKSYLLGDKIAITKLLGCPNYQQQINKIAHQLTKGTSISWEDAVQTAHEKVFIGLIQKKFQPEKGEFYFWAITVAKFAVIDLIRHEKPKNGLSLEETVPGKDYILSDIIADDFNLLDAVEKADLILKVQEIVQKISQHYPKRKYLILWQGKLEEKTQTQLAKELGITQSGVSKRWKELTSRIAEALGLLLSSAKELETTHQQKKEKKQFCSQL